MTPRTLILLFSASALTAGAANAHNYTYVDGGMVGKEDGNENDAGVRAGGSADILGPVALFGEYSDTGPFSHLSAGALFHTPLNSRFDLVAGGSIESMERGNRDDNGLGARAGLRWQAIPYRLEVSPEVRHVDIFDENMTSMRLAGLYHIDRNLDLQGAVQGGDDDRFELGVRYNFGPRLEAASFEEAQEEEEESAVSR